MIINSIKKEKNMEPKKIKKLVINQEVISNLNEQDMFVLKGGDTMLSVGINCPQTWEEVCKVTMVYPSAQCESEQLLCPQSPSEINVATCPCGSIICYA